MAQKYGQYKSFALLLQPFSDIRMVQPFCCMNKFNLPSLTATNLDFSKKLNDLMMKHYKTENLFSSFLSLYSINTNFLSTYLAPAYHYNLYAKSIYKAFPALVTTPKTETYSAINRIEFHSTLYSIKACLDRFVQYLFFYYKGFSKETTFGRIDTNGKAKGLMSIVVQNKDTDDVCKILYDNYIAWIKEAVKPRDRVTHSNDLPSLYTVDVIPGKGIALETMRPAHLDKNLEEKFEEGTHKSYDVHDIERYCANWYTLYSSILDILCNRMLPIKE